MANRDFAGIVVNVHSKLLEATDLCLATINLFDDEDLEPWASAHRAVARAAYNSLKDAVRAIEVAAGCGHVSK